MPKSILCLATVTLITLWMPQLGAQGVDANEELMKKIDSVLEKDIDELINLARGEGGEPGGEYSDINRPIDLEGDQWGGNASTSKSNPLVTEACQKEAMRDAINGFVEHDHLEPEEAVAKIKGHMTERAKALESITYSDYIAHIAKCKKLCGKTVKKLMGCHIEAVTNLDHELVFFDLDSTYVKDTYRRGPIGRLADSVEDAPEKNILLIGRASRIGQAGYNRTLSRRRARSVRDTFLDMGVEADRIKLLAFGYEPPQIEETLAQAYDLAELYERLGNHKMNQSVMMVVY